MYERAQVIEKKSHTKKGSSAPKAQNSEFSPSTSTPAGCILFLQRSVGNQVVQRLFKGIGGWRSAVGGQIQPKLTIGQPNDIYEQEADRVAEQVMRMPEPQVQRPRLEEEEEEIQPKPIAELITPLAQRQVEKKSIQTKLSLQKAEKDNGFALRNSIESRLHSNKGMGSSLSDEVRTFMESRFGADFSQVRVHTDSNAIQMTRDLNSQAFTYGRDIYFGAGKSPGTNALTAHEMTHVLQQTGGVRLNKARQQLPVATNRDSTTGLYCTLSGTFDVPIVSMPFTYSTVQRVDEIPPELLIPVNVANLTNEELRDRLRLIQLTLQQLMQSSPDTQHLQEEAYRIEAELFGRRCTRLSLSESEGEIPSELLISVNVADLTNEELRDRLCLIQATLDHLMQSSPDTQHLQEEAYRIEAELFGRRRSRLSSSDYERLRQLPEHERSRRSRRLISPSNSVRGTGGWLEYTSRNLRRFRGTFDPLLSPLGLDSNDLIVLSSTMTRENPDYRELPPEDLWPNMSRTLVFLAHLSASSGVTFEILSAYRSDVVNALSGGASSSAHMDFSGLDVRPSDGGRFEAFVKYYWHVRGRAHLFGLGFYGRQRVHIDTRRYRRWEAPWNTESVSTSRARYSGVFGTDPLPA